SAAEWAAQLRSAGIRYNLAPVADVVPEGNAKSNRPIAQLRRGYGSDPAEVGRKVASFIRGMADAKVATSVKHFPGLGQVVGNTDHEAATDSQTGPDSPLWEPFKAAVEAGVSSIMVSSAVYPQLDPGTQAMYSTPIVTGILRERLGFDKVLVSDDVGAAKALDGVPKDERGTRFLAAGGDLVITADSVALASMIEHTIAKAEREPRFAEQVTRSTARVLALKSEVELLDCG
ncbi:MAG: glycoside hydrolase family 3 N-terminal domain-containing protein, partial [Propionibacteriaceae bacterium]|nr:glycoside hydrolase family 3 N-terminal domain-containing protein [Propionibacteriaceae bacterium]